MNIGEKKEKEKKDIPAKERTMLPTKLPNFKQSNSRFSVPPTLICKKKTKKNSNTKYAIFLRTSLDLWLSKRNRNEGQGENAQSKGE